MQLADEPPHPDNRRGIDIHRPHVEVAAQEILKIASRAAARVEHAPPRVEAGTEQLIEQINVDLAEFHSQGGRDGVWGHGR